MSGDKDFIYDEDESVKFIQNYLPQELKGKFSNDDINYIVDLIYEFYESKGCMSEMQNGMESGSLLPKKSPLLYKARWRIANHWICLNK